jgi:hypothetical protein
MAERKDETAGAGAPGGAGGEVPDLEGARATAEDVGSLPVPRSVLLSKGRPVPPTTGSPYDIDRGLQPGARRPVRPAPGEPPHRAHRTLPREEEAQLRRMHARAARTPEELGRALSRLGSEGLRDPQRGKEGGPPLPGEKGYAAEE